MDAVQRMRQKAMDYGYLESNAQYRVVVEGPGDIEILPINPGYVYVPYYDPQVVFVARRPALRASLSGLGFSWGRSRRSAGPVRCWDGARTRSSSIIALGGARG